MSKEIIDQFLRGEIGEAELSKTVIDLSELERIVVMKEGIRLSALERQLEAFKGYEEELSTEDAENKGEQKVVDFQSWISSKRKTITSIAAAVALMAISVIIYNNSQVVATDNLYTEHYEFYAAVEGVRSDVNATAISAALGKYNQRAFGEAIDKFNELEDSYSRRHFYIGISHMELKNYSAAIKSFDQYAQSSKKEATLPYQYYTGLCFLKLKDAEKAKSYFAKVSKGTFGYEEALEILESI